MRIAILGPLLVSGNEVGGARVRSLIVRLALDPGQVVPADRLIDDLWPDDPPAHPAAALQSLVSRARREAPGLIVSHPSGYRLDLPPAEVDAWAFERLVRAGDARAALALWQGTALADAADLPFAAATAARLAELRLQALATRIAGDLDAGVADVAELEELVAAHPLREPFHALLVRALAARGRRGEALAAYERIRAALDEELGADPGPELRAAHLAALVEEPQAARSNLPARLTSFVGRATDVARLHDLLAGATRLVTLSGPGGVGKTRLAVEAAAAFDRVWLVELAAAADVRAAVEATLRTTDPITALRGTSTVLVLDNCEHLVDDAARVAEWLLTEVPDLRIIATSREPLDIHGESVHPVAPLDAGSAMELFRQRATAARPDANPAGEELAGICAELDGIPLAIELTAARLRSMPVSALVGELGDRLGFRGSRTAEPRHRTLRAVIDWSWELLTGGERALLRGLSAFSGGATLDAVRQVCGGDLATLSSLVDKSLVGLAGDRYTMLETIRRYARETGDLTQVLDAHARYYTELAEAAEPYLRTGDQLRRLAVLDAEHGNLDAALLHTADPLRLFLARLWAWVMRGRRREAREQAAAVLRRVARPQDGRELAFALCELITGAEPAEVVRESDHPAALTAWALAARLGPPDGVIELAESAVERLGGHPDPWTRAAARLMAGIVRFEYGEVARAEELLRPALDGFRATGDRWGLAFSLYWLSLAADNRGDHALALALAEESERPAAEIGGLEALPGPLMFLVRLGQLRARTGDLEAAAATLDRAWQAAQRADDPLAVIRVLHARGELARRSGDPDTAGRLLREALALVPEARPPLQLQALIHVELAQVSAPEEPLRRALELMESCDDRTVRASVLEAAAALAPPERAAVLLGAAGALRGVQVDCERCRAELGEERYRVASATGAAMPNPERYALSPPSSP